MSRISYALGRWRACVVFCLTVGFALGSAQPVDGAEAAPGVGMARTATPTGVGSRPAGVHRIEVLRDEKGSKLRVDGRDLLVVGMNWGYMPIGQNYNYNFWGKSDAFIKRALEPEMQLMRRMGVNVIRQYVGIPARWITYIYKKYGIFTVLNHPVGRYGHTVDGVWMSPINYENKRVRTVIRAEIRALAKRFRGTPGLLMWLLGNENNYGLAWDSAAVADLPSDKANRVRAEFLYSLMGVIIRDIKAIDAHHPVALANGDLGYIDLIAKHCKGLDVMGANVYRGASSRDIFKRVWKILKVPFMYTEFGADAWDAKRRREGHISQARYLKSQWQEIYEQSYGKGRVGNAIGGMIFQWSDGWWKTGQTVRLDKHDTAASWSNKAYLDDFVEGGNNMNEEWFGICAKLPNNDVGHYDVVPRTAYYVLMQGLRLKPYAAGTNLARIRRHWRGVDLLAAADRYKGASAHAQLAEESRVSVKNVRMEFSTFTTGGRGLDEQAREAVRTGHTESFFVDFAARPVDSVRVELSFNVLGNVAMNPINEIFYERRGKPVRLLDADRKVANVQGVQRFKVYGAAVDWDERSFKLTGYHRRGHFHWGYEGDFFGLYQKAYYGPAIDLYDADVPSGFEFEGKRGLRGFKMAFGPQVYWGANPMVLAKYQTRLLGLDFALLHQEDIAQREAAAVSVVVPQPKSRRTTLHLQRKVGALKFEVGGIMSGAPLVGRAYVRTESSGDEKGYLNSGQWVADDKVQLVDTLGTKAKISYAGGKVNAYLQGAYKGVVADGGPDQTLTFTGWTLKESGRGNQYNVLGGATFKFGSLQIAPNFLYQKPLVGPLPKIADAFDADTGTYFPGVAARNILSDPFVVRGNQEMFGYELLLVFDPTPATFFWVFDQEWREDAKLAASLDIVYRDYRQSQDGNIGVFADGGLFAFDAAPPARNLWEARLKLLSNPFGSLRMILEIYAGHNQSRGSDTRLIDRYGGIFRAKWERWAFTGFVKIDDWGPFDYHRDFNLTFPLQVLGDLSYGAVAARWLGKVYTRFGVRAQARTLDAFSPRYRMVAGTPGSHEWEVKTYLQVSR